MYSKYGCGVAKALNYKCNANIKHLYRACRVNSEVQKGVCAVFTWRIIWRGLNSHLHQIELLTDNSSAAAHWIKLNNCFR